MKRTVAFALMIPLLLSGCGARRAERSWREWQQELNERESIAFSAHITSRSETDAVTFSADVRAEGEEVVTEVTAPETIRGARFTSTGTGTELTCSETTLSLTALRPPTLPPCLAAALLLAGAREGHLLYTAERGGNDLAVFSGPEETTVTLIRGPEGALLAGEIARDGVTELTLDISDWLTKE